MADAFFILPHADDGDAVAALHIGGDDRKPTHHVTAKTVLKAFQDAEFWQQRAKETHDCLMKERAKIGRLMAALASEITGPVPGI